MVARYNSCGAPTEVGRRSYKTHARLYEDGPLFEILWYPARDDVPFKRGPNAINSLQWEVDRDGEFAQTAVGEDPEYPRVFQYETVNPLAIGGHVCGTAEDWAGDGVFDPDEPFVEYRPDGLPFCCGALFAGTGGLVLGGSAYTIAPREGTGGLVLGGSAYVVQPKVGTGGLVLGGSALVVWPGGYRSGYGGLVLGGSALVVWPGGYRSGYGGVVLGGEAEVTRRALPNTCVRAWTLAANEAPPFDLLASVGEYWFYYGSHPGGSHMHVSWPGVGLYDLTFAVLGGENCDLQAGIPTSSPHAGCYNFTVPTTQDIWLKIVTTVNVPEGTSPLIETGMCT